MKIVIDDKIPYIEGILEPYAEVEYTAGAKVTPEQVSNADAIITRTRTNCNQNLLTGSTVQFIATATIGFDHIDTEFCALNNIQWTNCPGCNSGSVKQYLTSTLLSLSIKHNQPLAGKTIGIVGVGNVGTKVADAARALGMKVLLNDPPRARLEGSSQFVSLDELLIQSDLVTTHTPYFTSGEDKTHHLASSEFFSKMKNSAFYINTSRGEICNNSALKTALQKKYIAGAVIDVWENEPGIDLELMDIVDFATPHVAGYSKDGKANGTSMSVQALAKFFDLPLQEWTPTDVPTPPIDQICIKPADTIELELQQAVSLSYDISSDDKRFRDNPSEFEYQRGNYPLRREFECFSVVSTSSTQFPTSEIFTNLGFKSSCK